jgi:hypothetical protein
MINPDEIDFVVLQPSDIRQILNIKNDEEYDLIVKSWRFLFDFLYAAEDGTQIVSNLVKFTKCGSLGALVSSENKGVEIEFSSEINEANLYDEIMSLIDDKKIIKLPTI